MGTDRQGSMEKGPQEGTQDSKKTRFIPTGVIHEWIRLTAPLRRGLERVPGYIRSEERKGERTAKGQRPKAKGSKAKGSKAKGSKRKGQMAKSGLREQGEIRDKISRSRYSYVDNMAYTVRISTMSR